MKFDLFTSTSNTLHGIISPPCVGEFHDREVIVIADISYSMNDPANPNGTEGAQYYSKLDLLKRAIEIIAKSMHENDKLTLITYNNTVNTILPRRAMDKDGQDYAINLAYSLRASGGTYLYDGLMVGMQIAEVCTDATVILLTDGQPSYSPPAGEAAELDAYRKAKNNRSRLYTFGLGYDINSTLLTDLANVGSTGGSFHFIPDGTMVITNFVNRMANERCIIAKDLVVHVVNPPSNMTVVSSYPVETTEGGFKVNIGTIKYGQQRDIVFTMPNFSDLTSMRMFATFTWTNDPRRKSISIEGALCDDASKKAITRNEVYRCMALKAIDQAARIGTFSIEKAREVLSTFMSTVPMTDDIPIINDILGEICTAISSQANWGKWGKHYLMALKPAHQNQECTNFKDPGLQVYGGDVFKTERTSLNNMCETLPLLKPSLAATTRYGQTQSAQVPTSNTQFNELFNNPTGGCFGENGNVLMADGSTKLVKDIVKGDVLHGDAKVVCVVTFASVATIKLSNDFHITPWHPVYVNNTWEFPFMIAFYPSNQTMNDTVRTFVLDKLHIATINGTQACTLGHGFEGPVISNDFYGTHRVIDALKKFDGWSDGLVHLSKENQVIDPKTGMVCDYSPLPSA